MPDTSQDSETDRMREQGKLIAKIIAANEQSQQENSAAMEGDPLPSSSAESIPPLQETPQFFTPSPSAANQTHPRTGEHKSPKESTASDPKKSQSSGFGQQFPQP